MIVDENEIENVTSTDSSQEQRETEAQNNTTPDYTIDDVAVTFDYQPPVTTSPPSNASGPVTSSNSRSRAGRNRLGRRIRKFYRRSRIGHCVTGFLTCLVFIVIGIAFVVTQLPNYIGVLFILVSVPPFLMTINKWRNVRRQDRIRREIAERRRALRRLREQRRENESYRRNNLPGPDLPPTYENLGYDVNDFDIDVETRSNSSSSSYDDAPPDYEEEEIAEKFNKIESSHNFGEVSAIASTETDSVFADHHEVG